jgi:hypothetical protein
VPSLVRIVLEHGTCQVAEAHDRLEVDDNRRFTEKSKSVSFSQFEQSEHGDGNFIRLRASSAS